MHDAKRTQADDEARVELRARSAPTPSTSVAPRDSSTEYMDVARLREQRCNT